MKPNDIDIAHAAHQMLIDITIGLEKPILGNEDTDHGFSMRVVDNIITTVDNTEVGDYIQILSGSCGGNNALVVERRKDRQMALVHVDGRPNLNLIHISNDCKILNYLITKGNKFYGKFYGEPTQ